MSNENDSKSRSRRARPSKKDSTQDLLSKMREAKASGTVYREEYVEENIYEYVTDEVYEAMRAQRRKENIVEDDSEYFDDGKDIMDESDEEVIGIDNKRKKEMKTVKNSNIKRRKSEFTGKLKDGNVMNMMKKFQPSKKLTEEGVKFEDILADLDTTSQYKKFQDFKNHSPFEKSVEKGRFKIDNYKTNSKIDSKTTTHELIQRQITKKDKVFENNLTFNNRISAKKISKELINTVMTVEEHEISNIMDCVNGDSTNSPNKDIHANATLPNLSEIDDLDDIDFDELFEESKGFCEPKKVNELSSKMSWDEDKEDDTLADDNCNTDLFTDVNDNTQTQIYWVDAYYDSKIKGAIFVFGKTYDKTDKQIVNCCVKVTGLKRRLYFLPKANYDFTQVHKELSSIFGEHKVDTFRCKPVTKQYAFQFVDVPDAAEYMMVEYDAKYASLPSNLCGETFSHVFGCETSILELFILDLKLKGPCWLNLANLKSSANKFSMSKFNYEINGIKGITKCMERLPNPPLSLLSLNIKTVVNTKTNSNEIVSIGYFIHNEVFFDQPPPAKVFQKYFIILTQPKDAVMPYDLKQKLNSLEWGERCKSVTIVPNERTLINSFLASIHKHDPDLIVGHSLFGHQLFILLQRCQSLNIGMWHRMGRLIRNVPLPKMSAGKNTSWLERMTSAGRLICDIEFSGRELVKCRSYELPDMIKEILPLKYHSLQNQSKIGDLSELFNNSNGVKKLIDITFEEALSNIYLLHELQILPLAYQITAICGNLIAKTLSSGKSERNEYLLLHAFNEKNYITPDKYSAPKDHKTDIMTEVEATHKSKRKPTYLGGLVLEPKKGFYENFILLMDFNSLYPSIIQELNICFTTIDRKEYLNTDPSKDNDSTDFDMVKINKLMELATNASDRPLGILPTEIRKLVESRQQIKNLLKEQGLPQNKKLQYDIRQKALKITANSMYGCLGFSQSRFQATQLASLITCKGRDILQNTKNLVETNKINSTLNLEIVYGDTDSIMVQTPFNKVSDFDTVMTIGRKIKQEINKKYKYIQIDIDGVFQKLLLLKKKKYAALTITKDPFTNKMITKQELKGLDIVRRDWCKLSVDVGHEVVTKILEGNLSQEDLALSVIEYLGSIRDEISSGKVLLDKFVITKALARNPEIYTNVEGQSHVQVALRYNKTATTRKFKAHDTVEYVICDDGTTRNASQRAYSAIEIMDSKSNLKIDSHYYLSHQLHPVISRLVDVIEGLSPDVVASSLGLEPKNYIKNIKKVIDEEQQVNDEGKFKECRPLSVVCLMCRNTNELSTPIQGNRAWPCSSCNIDLLSNEAHVLNTITRSINYFVKAYYQQVFTCQDLLCSYTCREAPIFAYKDKNTPYDKLGHWLCPHCGQGVMTPVIDETQLYLQIIFFKSIFADVKNPVYQNIHNHVNNTINNSAFAFVDLSKISHMMSTFHL